MPKSKQKNKQKHTTEKQGFFEKHLSPRLRKILLACGAAVVIAAISVGAWSISYYKSKPYNEVAISINGTTSITRFNMRYYVNTLKILYGTAPVDTGISAFADYGEQQIEKAQTIILGSQALGTQIKRSDVEAEVKKSGKPVTRERVDQAMAQDLIDQQVPANQPQYRIQAMLLESEAAAQAAKDKLKAGETFDNVTTELSKLPSSGSTPSSLVWETARQVDLDYGSTKFSNMVAGADVGTVSGPSYDDTVNKQYGYWVVKAVEKTAASDNTTNSTTDNTTSSATDNTTNSTTDNTTSSTTDNTTLDELHIQGILVGSEQDAKDVIDKLNAGADINELAKQVSQQAGANNNGAELGWITKNASPFDALFDLPLNTVVGPVAYNQSPTKGGYWLFTVLEKDNSKALTNDQQNTLTQDLITSCTAALNKDSNYKVENLLTQKMKDFALNQVVLAQGEGSVLISEVDLPIGEGGFPYSYKFVVYGTTQGNTWSISDGTLPEGLSFDAATGTISGTPRYAGASSFTIKVNNVFHYWTQDFVITIRIPISVSTASLPDGEVGTAYSAALEALTDSSTYNWSIVAGSLPDGLSLGESGYISGTPKTAGTYSFTVQVDDGMKKDTKGLSINIK